MRRLSFIESPLELRSVESLGRLDKKKLASVLHAASSIRPGKMSAPAGKKEQPKQEKKYLAQAVAAPKTPTGSGFSPLPSPPTWALSPQSAAKVIDATRPDAVNIDFDDGDGLPQRAEAAPEVTSAAPAAREARGRFRRLDAFRCGERDDENLKICARTAARRDGAFQTYASFD